MDPVRTQVKSLNFNSIVVIPVIKKESVIGTFLLRMASPLSDGVTKRIHKTHIVPMTKKVTCPRRCVRT